VLDVATGSADIPLAITRWARQSGHRVHVTGLDLHPITARIAKEGTAQQDAIDIVRGDALRLPFADGSFDYVITNMFLHHLDDDVVVGVLKEMDRVARRGIVAADLLRHRRAYFWISLFTCMSSPMLKHDARVSVAQAFTKAEVLAMQSRAKIRYARYFRHFGHRFVLAGERSSAGDAPENLA
jgi:ubiquinone/menaquinone biosynthesis C-methylase UbiE